MLSARASWRDQIVVAHVQDTFTDFVYEVGVLPPTKPADELQKAQGALVDSIPTEVIAPYTAIVAIIAANASKSDTFAALRWWTFAISFAFIIAYITASYVRTPSANRSRKLPFVEILGALIAFAAWGLAMPESPLSLSVTGAKFAVTSALISIGGAAVLGLLSLPLNSKSNKAK